KLKIKGTITAGMAPINGLAEPGTAWEIMTGAPVPTGYDSVIPVERTTQDSSLVSFTDIPQEGANIRKSGEDFSSGDPILTQGDLITAEVIMGLAATGIDLIPAYKQPNISIITTGNEISSKMANADKGIILDSNRPYLEAAIQQSGCFMNGSFSVEDTHNALAKQITSAAKTSDIILTTGGVSAGRMDFVPEVLTQLGAEILFHKVSIRPGKPILFAKLPDGTLIFGLPGNPVAVAVGWRFFVNEAIRIMLGKKKEAYTAAKLVNETDSRSGLRFFAKASAHVNADGETEVSILKGQQSFKISPLMKANCWAIFPEDITKSKVGEKVLIAPLTQN
ncbi:MAG: molybdopterin molybdotransferase MoeA, partial [Gammaproteobacteria bacterium]|nr:molybdopterin molybdotransferase MoeA [Gammaproteobacteria bacterium]